MASLVASLFIFSLLRLGDALSVGYYTETCPQAEAAVMEAVKRATANDNTVPAALLRMHFHDCFVRGCDASVLLNSKGNNTAEKDGPPNISLHAFYVIDNAKKAVEKLCPGVVSCADILALAARDAVALSGGPKWEVPKGRKDGRVSKASESTQLPAPTLDFSQLKQIFSQRGLSKGSCSTNRWPHFRVCSLLLLPESDPQLRRDPRRGSVDELRLRGEAEEGVPGSQQGKERRISHGFHHHSVRQRLLQAAHPREGTVLFRRSSFDPPQDQTTGIQVCCFARRVLRGFCQVHDQNGKHSRWAGSEEGLQGG
ncbi:unnamed protein product [Musa acuminata var. zebrina]